MTDSLFGLNFSNASNDGAFMGGGQVGFNYEFSNIVLGVEWVKTRLSPRPVQTVV